MLQILHGHIAVFWDSLLLGYNFSWVSHVASILQAEAQMALFLDCLSLAQRAGLFVQYNKLCLSPEEIRQVFL